MGCHQTRLPKGRFMKLLIFAGTTEGRTFAEKALECGFEVTVSVATKYGGEILEEKLEMSNPKLKVLENRLNQSGIENLAPNFNAVIDATHPFAIEVTKNIKKACKDLSLPYYRLLRECASKDPAIIYFDSLDELCRHILSLGAQRKNQAELTEEKIFISTGSKELECFTKIPDYKNRCFVRVLPNVDSIQKCLEAGFLQSHIFALQGPFSKKMNAVFFEETGASILITKESGKNGGFDEKILAAKERGMKIFCVRHPPESGDRIFTDSQKLISALKNEFES